MARLKSTPVHSTNRHTPSSFQAAHKTSVHKKNKKSASGVPGVVKKRVKSHSTQHDDANASGGKRKWKSGTVAKREIRKLSNTTHTMFPAASFNRLIRQIAQDYRTDMHFSKDALKAIHEASEHFVTNCIIKANLARRHTGRKTLQVKDIQFAGLMTDDLSLLTKTHFKLTSELVGNNRGMSTKQNSNNRGPPATGVDKTAKKNMAVAMRDPSSGIVATTGDDVESSAMD